MQDVPVRARTGILYSCPGFSQPVSYLLPRGRRKDLWASKQHASAAYSSGVRGGVTPPWTVWLRRLKRVRFCDDRPLRNQLRPFGVLREVRPCGKTDGRRQWYVRFKGLGTHISFRRTPIPSFRKIREGFRYWFLKTRSSPTEETLGRSLRLASWASKQHASAAKI